MDKPPVSAAERRGPGKTPRLGMLQYPIRQADALELRQNLCVARVFMCEWSSSMSDDLVTLVTDLARCARAASLVLATSSLTSRHGALERLASLIDSSHEPLLAANQQDLATAQEHQLTPAQIDRLTLTPTRLQQLAAAVREVVALPDPLGESLAKWT
jgi:hypothetical protein